MQLMGSSTNLRCSRVVAYAHCAPRNGGAPPPIWRRHSDYYPVLRNHLTALIIDGSEFQRIYHRTLLSSFCVEIWEVEDGNEALGVVQRGIEFDVILIDMDLPVLDGASTTRTLRSMGVGCIIIGLAAYTNRERDQQAFIDDSGLDDYHEQLFTYERLLPILRRIDDEH